MEKDRKENRGWGGHADLVKLQFTDLRGQLKTVEILADKAEQVLEDGYAVSRFALQGLNGQEEEAGFEILKPDPHTACLLPWESGQENVARLICDVCGEDGAPSWADSRSAFKKIIGQAEEMGLQALFDFQCEFYLFHTDDNGRPTLITHEAAGYYDAGPIDLAENVRRDMILSLAEAGIEVESAHHGLTPGQHCFLLPAREGVDAADCLMTFKAAVKRIAKRHGLHASFMPKPNMSGSGSGFHVGITLRGGAGKETVEDAKYFRSGILNHLRDMMLITNPAVNSYKRLAAGRIPVFSPEALAGSRTKGGVKRIEVMFPDPSANPYLVLGALLSAGLDGIKNRAVEGGGRSPGFPGTLGEAIGDFENSGFVKSAFGDRLCDRYLGDKKEEWERFCTYVTDWEIKEYLYRF